MLLSLLHTAVFDTSFRASNALFSSGISGEAGAAPSKEQTYSLASCIEEITKHVELLKQELEKPYTSAHCLKWADLLFSDTSYVFGGSND